MSVGQRVEAGDRLAGVTNWTGGGDHVHVELWKTFSGGYDYEHMIDPMKYSTGSSRVGSRVPVSMGIRP